MKTEKAIKRIKAFRDYLCGGNPIWDVEECREAFDIAIAAMEQRWIPVSERLPGIDMSYPHHEHYLVQYDSGNMDVASWSNVNRFWADHVTEPHWNCVQFAEVIAWMPLPEPWKGEEDERSN